MNTINKTITTIIGRVRYVSGYRAILTVLAVVLLSGCQFSAPKQLIATAGDGQAYIEWSSVSSAMSFNIYSSTLQGTAANGQRIATVTGNVFTHRNLTNGNAYYYTVRAVNADGVESESSAEISVTPRNVDADLIAGRYLVVGFDGSAVRDVVTDLEWPRCVVGQTWSAEHQMCFGDGFQRRWLTALKATASGGFRLPSVEELRTIVYCSNTGKFDSNGTNSGCGVGASRPTLVQAAFPNPPLSTLWTRSAHTNPDNAWVVNFREGNVGFNAQSNADFVRLVRDGG